MNMQMKRLEKLERSFSWACKGIKTGGFLMRLPSYPAGYVHKPFTKEECRDMGAFNVKSVREVRKARKAGFELNWFVFQVIG